VIPAGVPFAGRLAGGATRDQVYGNSRIGSGYPYGGYGSYYGGRPFPYYFYPVYIIHGYYGGDEYGPSVNATRPGGALSTAVIQPAVSSSNSSSIDSFYIFGDESSVSLVLDALISQCAIANSSVKNTFPNGSLSSNGTSLTPRPEQMIQYYRASSFALALSSYNNSATPPSNAPVSNSSAERPTSADTPLPKGLNLTLLACLNSTIASSIPLLDTANGKTRLSSGAIAGIVVGCLVGIIIGWALLMAYRKRRRSVNDPDQVTAPLLW